jgi:hypothetical protein
VSEQPATGASSYLVEHYWPGVTVEAFRGATERVRAAAAAMAREGAYIRFLHSTMVPADEAAFCAFDATSAELVEQAYARAGVRFERLVETVELPGSKEPSGGLRSATERGEER